MDPVQSGSLRNGPHRIGTTQSEKSGNFYKPEILEFQCLFGRLKIIWTKNCPTHLYEIRNCPTQFSFFQTPNFTFLINFEFFSKYQFIWTKNCPTHLYKIRNLSNPIFFFPTPNFIFYIFNKFEFFSNFKFIKTF